MTHKLTKQSIETLRRGEMRSLLLILLFIYFASTYAYHHRCKMQRNLVSSINQQKKIGNLSKSQIFLQINEDSDSSNNAAKDEYMITKSSAPQGYLNPDFNKVGDGKQIRVLVYIVLALLPCLFLIPFFMTRDFVPPTDF